LGITGYLAIYVYAMSSVDTDITNLLSADKQRCAVLVYELVAAVGVDMSHFCAVNVERRLVLINSHSFREHGWTSTQAMPERSTTSTLKQV